MDLSIGRKRLATNAVVKTDDGLSRLLAFHMNIIQDSFWFKQAFSFKNCESF